VTPLLLKLSPDCVIPIYSFSVTTIPRVPNDQPAVVLLCVKPPTTGQLRCPPLLLISSVVQGLFHWTSCAIPVRTFIHRRLPAHSSCPAYSPSLVNLRRTPSPPCRMISHYPGGFPVAVSVIPARTPTPPCMSLRFPRSSFLYSCPVPPRRELLSHRSASFPSDVSLLPVSTPTFANPALVPPSVRSGMC